ncbi:MAG TPA: xylulokinase [Caldilineae bacterium]|nr:xylulokinase [Caldilineae bacterium]
MAPYILAHDLGTTGNKATLYDVDGQVVARAFQGYETYHPHGNWAEQDAADWWEAVEVCTRRLLAEARVAPEDVACISFSGQMQGCLPVDERGRPLRRCIIWADQRAVAQAASLEEKLGMERVYRITGHRISPTYSGSKIMWVREHEPDVFAQTHKFLHVKDYIAFRLTGRFVTDRSDASGMNLYDLKAGTWSGDILDAIDLDVALLPEIHDSTDVVGEVTREAAEALGLRPGTPVVIGGGDGACATVGAGAVREGVAYNYIGSSSWIAFTSPEPILDPGMKVFTFAHMVPGKFFPCGTMQSAGGSYQWLRRQICISEEQAAEAAGVDVYEIMNLKAEQSPPGANRLIFLPYLLGERSPHWNPRARGAFIGLTVRHTRADIIRATLEGITFNLKLILQTFLDAGAEIREMRVIGGGARGRFWRQLMADIYRLPILRPRLLEEATSLGAAVAGGVGVGLFESFDVVDRFIEIIDRHEPDPATATVYERLFPIFQAAYEALCPVYEMMQDA